MRAPLVCVLPPAVISAFAAIIFASTAALRASEFTPSETTSVRRTLKDPAPGMRKAVPDIKAASDEALNAVQTIKTTGGLEVKLWAAEPMLANPVAFNIDEKGRVFVTETYRYRSSTLDIRNYLWMDEEDLASRTVEDRAAMLLRNFGPEGVKELSIESEIVRLLEDTDGD
ncbi:MAG: hypothetical protein ABIR80_12430, partial [Opitutaceae bacterium]